MVCLGNICRSPLAEGILKEKIRRKKLDWQVDSAGIGGWHAGELPDHRSIAIAQKYGIDLADQRARKFQVVDFQKFDLVFAMDTQNFRDLQRLAQTDAHRSKIELILNQSHPNENRSVPDPYYGGDEAFEQVFQMLDQACEAFLKSTNPPIHESTKN